MPDRTVLRQELTRGAPSGKRAPLMRTAPASSLFLVLALAACGGSTPELAFVPDDTLAAAFELYGGPRDGDVELTRTVKVIVDTAVKPGDAESRFEVQVAATRFTPSEAPLAVHVLTPPGAELASVHARVGPTSVTPLTKTRSATALVDPEQQGWLVTFPAPASGAVLEAIIRFTVPGTITSDAQWLAAPGTDELLLRYDLPSDAAGSFRVNGAELAPVVTEQGGRKVIALFVQRAYALPPGTHARYTTPMASPKGFEQRFTGTWAEASRDYVKRLVDVSDGLDEGYEAPFRPAGPDVVASAYMWVRDRGGAGADAAWHASRGLREPLEKNALTGTDRVHLLHWILRAAGVAHRFAMARPARFPAVAADFPVPGAFAVPIVLANGLWLDPGCATCAPGDVRAELAGGQALLLPVAASGVELVNLPTPRTTP